MTYLLPITFILALALMIYAAVLAFKGEIQRPLALVGIAGSSLWLAWEATLPL